MKPTYFPIKKLVRLAPLQKNILKFVIEKRRDLFSSESDFIRKAISLQAKESLTPEEFEFVCGLYKSDVKK